jgi:hypothetical protein
VEGCSWEEAAPPVKDPHRIADPSTLRRWFQTLDSSRPIFSSLRRTAQALRRNWTGCRVGACEEFMGLCPLHPETRPSFYVNARKNLFYCHGCQRGGDLIRFVGLSEHLSFRQSLACLKQDVAPAAESELLDRAAAFYQLQLHRHSEATGPDDAVLTSRDAVCGIHRPLHDFVAVRAQKNHRTGHIHFLKRQYSESRLAVPGLRADRLSAISIPAVCKGCSEDLYPHTTAGS